MIGAHGWHELAMLMGALILSIGGGAILVRAAFDRRAARGRSVPVPLGAGLPGTSPGAERRSALGAVRRAETLIAVGLSAGAAAIHLAAGPAHVEELGDLGLGFYWAALFQGMFAIAWLGRPGSRCLASVAIAGNLAILGAWAWARTIGLPTIAGGPESIGVADGTAVVLQIGLVALLAARMGGLGTWAVRTRSPAGLRTAATSGLVAILGVVALSTTIAVADAAAGHHDDGADGGHGAVPTIAADAPHLEARQGEAPAHGGHGAGLTIP